MLREVRNTSHKSTRRNCLKFDFELQFICTCLIIDVNVLQGCKKFLPRPGGLDLRWEEC